MADHTQEDMIAVAKGVHEQVREQIKDEYACLFVIVHRGGDMASAGDIPPAMLSNVLERVRKLSADGSSKMLYLPPGCARA